MNEEELLFFDTFSHEVDTDINLDLVQFPKPVYITQVRIIPLGARVQADFPGGVRLGATNPSKFGIEFFVNDLGMPGASTFENLGQLEYNQNDCIHLECTQEKIPTDGLVLRGWYSTITLAVYGILTNAMNEVIASPPPPSLEAEDELCEVSAAATAANSGNDGEDELKDEWKEPEITPHVAHKTQVRAEYEASLEAADEDEMEYELNEAADVASVHPRRDSHHHQRSSRLRTSSGSHEREYRRSRDKPPRSPSDYGHRSRRKRSDAEEQQQQPHKWPRTPPASIDSPSRPRSPDLDYTDEEPTVYPTSKLKSRIYMRSDESLGTPAEADDDSTPGGGEQFEPILSDDEIMGDDDDSVTICTEETPAADEAELEILNAAKNAQPAILSFDAFKMPLCKYAADPYLLYAKDLENLQTLQKKLLQQPNYATVQAFMQECKTVDERENFVYFGEAMINQLSYLAQNYKRNQFVLQHQLFKEAYPLSMLQIALSFEAACLQPQPAFKIRHIKMGVRLTELLSASQDFVDYMLNDKKFNVFEALFQLFHQEYMALSIKLMILKSIYALVDTKTGRQYFLQSGKINGYQLILETLQQTSLTRTKYALQSIVKKMNLNEALACIREKCTQLFVFSNYNTENVSESHSQIELCISQLIQALTASSLTYQQPRRYLPVSKKFDITTDAMAQRSFDNGLQAFFQQNSLAESLLLLFSNAGELPAVLLMRCIDLLHVMLQTHVGLDYLVDDCFETTQMLIAVLLGLEEIPQDVVEEEVKQLKKELVKDEVKTEPDASQLAETKEVENSSEKKTVETSEGKKEANCSAPLKTANELTLTASSPLQKCFVQRLQRLGLELACKIQTRYHLDAIFFGSNCIDYDAMTLSTHLHALYSQTCNVAGRKYTVEVLGFNNNLQVFMDLIKKEQRMQTQRQLSSSVTAKYKSPVLSYAVDVVDCCVRYADNLNYLLEHGGNILELAKNHDNFEPSVSAVLQEMFVYLKPLESINIFSYDDIAALVELINRSMEYITTFPGDLIMSLRILRHLVLGCNAAQATEAVQLKHRFVALQFYAADGVQILIQIMEKLCSYFEQPGLHTPALASLQGAHCCQIMLPTLQILRQLITLGIQCRDVEFKDLTAIDHLMKSYCLLYYFPANSQAGPEVAAGKQEIIQTLLAYTQPNEQDEESLHKSLWTLMIREILKTIDAPFSFMPGLQVLSELLPLPLPMPLPKDIQLQESQTQRLITERKLWSAHLHPQSTQIAKLIETIAPSTFPQLSDLMVKVCIQLADLAPNMTLLISKTLTDLLCNEWMTSNQQPSQHLIRLLSFFARLTVNAALKSSALSILSGKLWDLFQSLLSAKDLSDLCLKCQVLILRILENFLDSEISLISPKSISTPELNLASALPPKELIPRIVDSILNSLFSVNVISEASALGVRNLVILTEHDITFYYLSLALKQRSSEFQAWIKKIVELNETSSYNSNIESLILLLRSLIQVEETTQADSSIPNRTLKLNAGELVKITGFGQEPEANILERMSLILKKTKSNENSIWSDMEKLTTLMKNLESNENKTNMETEEETSTTSCSILPEPVLPQTEGIVTQYSARPLFLMYSSSNLEAEDLHLSSRYWLAPLSVHNLNAEDFETQYERIACDLTELSNNCLSTETNLSSDCKRVLHLSASPQSNRERTPTAPCFRTRRVEVEPNCGGRPEKKIYITAIRGRGFPRPPPTRGDLFRSRPPNTSRPPSLHVDDFLALETHGVQPTGPTGYNKIPSMMRGSRVGRNRGSRLSLAATYRKPKLLRTSSPSTWETGTTHYRIPSESHFSAGETHYSSNPHFNSGRRGRGRRPFMR